MVNLKDRDAQMKFWTCKKCGHEWVNRKPRKPIVCPKCKKYTWDEEPELKGDKGVAK